MDSKSKAKAESAIIAATEYTKKLSNQRQMIRSDYGVADPVMQAIDNNTKLSSGGLPFTFYDAYSGENLNF